MPGGWPRAGKCQGRRGSPAVSGEPVIGTTSARSGLGRGKRPTGHCRRLAQPLRRDGKRQSDGSGTPLEILCAARLGRNALKRGGSDLDRKLLSIWTPMKLFQDLGLAGTEVFIGIGHGQDAVCRVGRIQSPPSTDSGMHAPCRRPRIRIARSPGDPAGPPSRTSL